MYIRRNRYYLFLIVVFFYLTASTAWA